VGVVVKDYYSILGVGPAADADTIKSAYRQLARRYHPDFAKRRDAKERFLEVQEAYDTLCDPGKRAVFDRSRLALRPFAPTARRPLRRTSRRPPFSPFSQRRFVARSLARSLGRVDVGVIGLDFDLSVGVLDDRISPTQSNRMTSSPRPARLRANRLHVRR